MVEKTTIFDLKIKGTDIFFYKCLANSKGCSTFVRLFLHQTQPLAGCLRNKPENQQRTK
jgi:hypothetical protein